MNLISFFKNLFGGSAKNEDVTVADITRVTKESISKNDAKVVSISEESNVSEDKPKAKKRTTTKTPSPTSPKKTK
jgi:hypothetical protein